MQATTIKYLHSFLTRDARVAIITRDALKKTFQNNHFGFDPMLGLHTQQVESLPSSVSVTNLYAYCKLLLKLLLMLGKQFMIQHGDL